jgi:hypothetical protein
MLAEDPHVPPLDQFVPERHVVVVVMRVAMFSRHA